MRPYLRWNGLLCNIFEPTLPQHVGGWSPVQAELAQPSGLPAPFELVARQPALGPNGNSTITYFLHHPRDDTSNHSRLMLTRSAFKFEGWFECIRSSKLHLP